MDSLFNLLRRGRYAEIPPYARIISTSRSLRVPTSKNIFSAGRKFDRRLPSRENVNKGERTVQTG